VYVIAALWAAMAVPFVLSSIADWTSVWWFVRVPPMWPPFADLRTITGGLHTVAAGGDPLVANPFDPWQRQMNYPRIWLSLFAWLGVDDGNVWVVGLLFVVLFLGSVSYLIRSARSTVEALALALAGVSYAALFAVERGNTDLLAFTLVLVTFTTRTPWIALLALPVASILKLFPAVGFLALGLSRPRHWRAPTVVVALATLGVILGSFDDLARIARGTPVTALWSFGVASIYDLVGRLGRPYQLSESALFAAGAVLVSAIWLVGVLVGLAGWRRPAFEPGAAHGQAADWFIGFGLIYAATFFVGSNYVYRLIFVVPMLPLLCREGRRAIVGPVTGFHLAALLLFVLNVDAAGHYGLVVGHVAKLLAAYAALYMSAGLARRRWFAAGSWTMVRNRPGLPAYHQGGAPS
jgi:hypothetical protein